MSPSTRLALIIVLALASVTAITLAFRYDHEIRKALVADQGKNWKKTDDYKFYTTVRKYGDYPQLMLLGAIGLLIAWKLRSREWIRIVVAAIIASTLAGMVANASRLTTGRTRPRESPKIEQGFYGPWHNGKLLIGDPRYNSFPSGHTATAFGFAGAILFASPWIGIAALVPAALIAWASVVIGAHHPSDVTVSIILSLVVAFFVWRWVRTKGDLTWLLLVRKVKQLRNARKKAAGK